MGGAGGDGEGGREGIVSFSSLSLKYPVEFFDYMRLLIGLPPALWNGKLC